MSILHLIAVMAGASLGAVQSGAAAAERPTFIEMTTMLPSADFDRSVRFYQEVLGFEVSSRNEQIVLLRAGGASLYLVPDSPPTSDKPGVSILRKTDEAVTPINLTFRVENVESLYERLKNDGVTFLAPPEIKFWGEIRVFTRDPDGYLIEFYQPFPESDLN